MFSYQIVAAARWMKQEGTAAFARWLTSRETLLYQGHADKIADELEKTARKEAVNAEQLNTAAGYFRTGVLQVGGSRGTRV